MRKTDRGIIAALLNVESKRQLHQPAARIERKAVEDAYSAAKEQKLSSAQGYPGNNFNEYWATGIEAYVFGSGRGRDTLLAADPRLYELVRQVIPATKMPGNVYIGRTRATLPPK